MDYLPNLLVFLFSTVLLSNIDYTESYTGTHCDYKIDGRDVREVCVYGECTSQGCVCHHCYGGKQCNEPVNQPPKFKREQYDFTIVGKMKDLPIIAASDADENQCSDLTEFACPCGLVKYAINSGNELGLFTIGKTGKLKYEENNHFLQNVDDNYGKPFKVDLEIEAKNKYPSGEEFISTTRVHIEFEQPGSRAFSSREGSMNEVVDLVPSVIDSYHHRSKRAAPTPGIPTNVSMHLDKHRPDANVDIKVGEKIGFTIHMWIRYTTELSLECFAPPDLFIISEPTTHDVGSDLTSDVATDMTTIKPVMTSTTNDKRYDMFNINYGTVSNPNPDGGVEDNMKMKVTFNVYAGNAKSINTSETHWISCGAVYYGSYRIWVGQASFTFSETYTPSGNLPGMTTTGVDECMIGQTCTFELSVTMKEASQIYTIDGFAPINNTNIMSICSVRLKSHGKGLDSYNYDRQNLTFTKQDGSANINAIGTASFGEILNSEFPGQYGVSSPTDADQTFVVELFGKLLNTSDLEIGSTYEFGVSAEMSDINTIYTATKSFVAKEFNCTKPDESPTLSFTCHNTDIYVGGRTTCQFNMTLPQGVTDDYHLEILVPFNMTAEMNICDVSFKHIGYNFPCFSDDQVTITYKSQSDGSSNKDFVILDLGLISNTGSKNDSTSSTISVEITAQLLDFADTDGTGNGTGYACAGMSYACGTIYVVANPVNFLTANSTLGSLSPTFSVNFVLNDRDKHNMYKGGQGAVWVDMHLPKGSFFSEILVDAVVPMKDGIPAYEFCYKRVTIKHIGGNIKCSQAPDPTFESNYITGVYDAVSMKMGNISNTGQYDEAWNKNESTIRIEIIVCSRNHPNITDGTKLWTKVSVQYDATKIWVGSAAHMNNASVESGSLSIFDDKPKFSIARASPSDYFYPGELALYNITFTLTPRTIIPYTLEGSISENGTLSLCSMTLISDSKNNVVGPSPIAVPETYGTKDGNFKMMWDMMNIGVFDDKPRTAENEAENQMTVQVAMKVSESPDVSSANSSFFVNAADSVLFVSEVQVFKNDSDKPSLDVDPVVKFRRNDSNACVPIGGYEVMWVDLYIPPGSLASYQVEAFSPGNLSQTEDNTMFLCDLRLIQGNTPCLHGDVFSASYYGDVANATSRYHNGRLNLGRIPGNPGTGAVEEERNRMIVEIVAFVPSGGNVSVGDQLKIGASVMVDSDRLWVGQQMIEICDTYEPKMNDSSKVSLNVSCAGDGSVDIASTIDCTITASIPEGTTNITFEITTPKGQVQSNDQGVLLFPDVPPRYLDSFGRHYYCTDQLEDKLKHEYIGNSFIQSEITDGTITVGYITNIGLCNRYQWGCGTPEPSWDAFSLNFTLFATDSPLNVNNAVQTFNVTMQYDNDRSVTTPGSVTIARSGTEEPQLQAQLYHDQLPTDVTQINPGYTVRFCIQLNHTEASKRHAFGVKAIVYLQSYLNVDTATVVQTGRSDATKATVVYDADKGRLVFSYANAIVFTDQITICFNATIDKDNRLATGSRLVHATVLMDVMYNRATFPDATYPTATDQSHNLDTLMDEFNFYVPDCNEVLNIQPCQVTLQPAGEVLDPTNPAHPRFGDAYPYEQTVQITMGNKTHVTGVTFSALKDVIDTFNANVTLSYSQEGSRWENYVVNGTSDLKYTELYVNGSAIDTNTKIFMALLEGPIIAKYLRMRFHIPDSVSDFNMMHEFTYDLNGCYLSNEATLDDACPKTENKTLYERGYLMDPVTGALYVCYTDSLEYGIQCAFTTDFGESWTEVDENVANVNFLRKDTKELYGTSRNKKSRMRSDDGGMSWCGIPDLEYEIALTRADVQQIIGVKQLPFTNWNVEVGNTAAQDALFKQVYNGTLNYNANSVGLVLDDGSGGGPQVMAFWED